MYDIEKYVLLFFIYAFLGWIMEVIGKLIQQKKFINRGFLIGPYCPIYGHGAILITILLSRYKANPFILFFMAILICSILEYATSYFMEKIFHARWWDYSQYKFNINGRICLRTMIPFGILGCFIIYISNPLFLEIIEKIPQSILLVLCIFLVSIFIIDNLISFNIIRNVQTTGKKIKDNTEEITQKVKEILIKRSILHRRLIQAFPNMKIRIKQKIKQRNNRKENQT
ncbi:MAG: putative ABC transporter permease [Clostridia bacterium]